MANTSDVARGEYVLVHVMPREEPRVHRLLGRPMNVGSDKGNDIVIQEAGVERRHARVTAAEHGPMVWDLGTESGVLVNGVRKASCELNPGDLVQVGDAMLVICLDPLGGGPVVETTTARMVGAQPFARFAVIAGTRKGESFYMGSVPLVLGRHRLASIHFEDRSVAQFHAHLAIVESGIRLVDLRSPAPTKVNDEVASWALLKSGDVIALGQAKLQFEQLAAISLLAPEPPKPQSAQEPEPAPEAVLPDIPLDAEIDLAEGEEAVGAEAPAREPAAADERYQPGDLVLTAIDGPIEGQFLPLSKRRIILGRGGIADLVIPDLSVSRKHALITLSEDGRLEIQDLGSRNGVRVNGRKVNKAALRAGDAIRVGTTALIVERRGG